MTAQAGARDPIVPGERLRDATIRVEQRHHLPPLDVEHVGVLDERLETTTRIDVA